ncbi:43kDa postsynaptic protein [Parasponia andersonii]|uniref:43kDa postsynaptic protein n=1 Tax=Parasponia andersonii TaxID=3476 RepID=A0A2P5D061_PARAD|nr:43kDa postsynaptic protein [Parasponia andersonii]
MCSTIGGLSLSHRKLQNFIVYISHNLTSSTTSATTYDDNEWCSTVAFAARLFAYITFFIALVITIVLVIVKFLFEVSNVDRASEDAGEISTETNPLMRPEKTVMQVTYYGTCEEEYVETGSCSNSSSDISRHSSCSEDLYDGKLCVICYDNLRNCFFVPCGHCATCYDCAQRIFFGESKSTCPVCRRFIRKVRKLFTA